MGWQQNLAAIRDTLAYTVAINARQVTENQVIGAAKMGFSSITEMKAFGDAKEKFPAADRFLDKVGDLSNGNNRFDSVLAAAGSKYKNNGERFLRELDADLRDNPQIERQLLQAIQKNPTAAAGAIRAYTGVEDRSAAGNLERLINNINNPPARSQPAAAATSTPPPARERTRPAPASNTSAPRERVRPAPVAAAASVPDPAPAGETAQPVSAAGSADVASSPAAGANSATAGAAVASAAGSGASAAPATTGAALPNIKAADVVELADGISSYIEKQFPDMGNDVQTFKNRLKTDQQLQAQIAENLNNNPEFVTTITGLASRNGSEEKANPLLQQMMAPAVRDLLQHPEKLANDSYVDGLNSQLSGGGGGSGMLSGLLGGLGDFGKSIMSFIQPLIDMVGNLFKGFSAGGGMGNFLSMGNGNGGMFENLMSGITQAHSIGKAVSENERFINEQGIVVDQNKDGRFDEADQIDVNGRKLYEIADMNDGHSVVNGERQTLRAYASKVDPNTGAIIKSEVINVTPDGGVTRTHPDTGQPITEPTPRGPEVAGNRPLPNSGLDMRSPGAGPAGPTNLLEGISGFGS